MRNVWDRYDAEESGSKVFTSLIAALKRLVTEKPALLGVCAQMFGVGVQTSTGSSSDLSSYGLDVGGVAGMVATAASATVSGVASMIGPEVGLSLQGSSMKLQWSALRLCFATACAEVALTPQYRPVGQGGLSHHPGVVPLLTWRTMSRRALRGFRLVHWTLVQLTHDPASAVCGRARRPCPACARAVESPAQRA